MADRESPGAEAARKIHALLSGKEPVTRIRLVLTTLVSHLVSSGRMSREELDALVAEVTANLPPDPAEGPSVYELRGLLD